MTVPLPELGSVHVREAPSELVLAVAVPEEIDLSRVSARLGSGVLEIRVPRVRPARASLARFHPDASGV